MKLIDPTDVQLNAAFAVYVMGWKSAFVDKNGTKRGTQYQGENINWAGSADAVLPWLEQHYLEAKYWTGHAGERPCWRIGVEGQPTTAQSGQGGDKSFARAAVIALLRANGVEVTFS